MTITLQHNDKSVVIGNNMRFALGRDISGLEIPSIRTSSQNYSGRDGGRVNAQYYSQRMITIPGYVGDNTCPDHEAARKELQAALPIRTPVDVIIDTWGGARYLTSGHIIDFKMSYTNKYQSEFLISILCKHIYFLDETQNTVVLSIFVGGGFTIPFTLPISFEPGFGVAIANNEGTEIIYPNITINGQADTPKITNLETGQFISFNLTMSTGDVLVIDMDNRTAALNGSSILSLRDNNSAWWGLLVGANRLRFDTDNGEDDATATVQWRNAVLTI